MGYRLLESLFNCQLRFLAVYQVVCLGSSFFNFEEKSIENCDGVGEGRGEGVGGGGGE